MKYLQNVYRWAQEHPLYSIGIFALLVYLPFLNKPFHMDDPFFIYAARAIDLSPLHPFTSTGFYDLWKDNFNSIAFYYFPGLIRAIGGENEILMHSVYFIFFLTAALYLYSICGKAGINSIVPALLFTASPIVLLTGTSTMSDFPFLTFILVSFYHLVSYVEKNRAGDLAISIVFLLAAVFTKYYAAVFIGLYALVFLMYGRRKELKYLALSALVVMAALIIASFSSQVHIFYVLGKMGWIHSPIRKETLSFLTTLGGVSIFPLCFLLLLGKDKLKLILYVVSLFAAFIVSGMAALKPLHAAAMAVYSANALLIFFIIGRRLYLSLREKNNVVALVSVWFFLYSAFLAFFPNIMAGRYVLPLLPPFMICLYLEIQEIYAARKNPSLIVLFSTLILGLILNAADSKLANIYRDFGKEASASIYVKQTGYLGHYAFDYYMQKNGFERFDIGKHKYLLMSKYGSAHIIYGGSPVLEQVKKNYALIDTITKNDKYLVRVWDPTAFAGFHLNMYGYLPWGISSSPMETFYLFARKDQHG